MPYIAVKTSAHISQEKEPGILARISETASYDMGKPEAVMMVSIEKTAIMLGGTLEPAAFVMVRGIGGVGGAVNKVLSRNIAHILDEELGIPVNRTYLNFVDVPGANWGVSGTTFA